MSAAEAETVAATGELHGEAWPFPLTLVVDGSAVPTDQGELALVDPEGVVVSTLTIAGAQQAVAGQMTVWGRTSHLTREAPVDFPALHLDPAGLRAVAKGSVALVTSLPPTAAVETALDGLAASRPGAAVVVLLAVGADLGDRAHATVLAWRAALSGRPRIHLCLVRSGAGPERSLPLAVVAAAESGCAGVAVSSSWREAGSSEAALAAFARRRGLDVVELGVSRLAPADLARSGAASHAGEFSAAAAPHVRRGYPAPAEQGVTVMFTGLSGSGKSTIARSLSTRLREHGPRRVTLLDGDVVRSHLTSGLGFSAADRRTNVERITWVAAQLTRHGGLAVCAPIAPYETMRQLARQTVQEHGAFVLVHVATSLEECERRDRKGLYAKARRGELPEFTGISDVYEEPTDADVTVDTVEVSVDEAVEAVLEHLDQQGLLTTS